MTSGGQYQNQFYAMDFYQEKESSPDIVIGMLYIFDLDVYVLLEIGSNFYLIIPLSVMSFDISLKNIFKPFPVLTPISESFFSR